MNNIQDRKWQTVEEEVKYDNGFLKLFQNKVIDPNGNTMTRNLITMKNGSVAIIPVKGDFLYLVGQHRYAANTYSYEFPNGGVEKDEDPLAAAKRELEEEVGLSSDNWRYLGEFDPLNSLMRRKCHVYLADGVYDTEDRINFPDEYEKLEILKMSIFEFEKMIVNNEIADAFTIASYMKFKLFEKEKLS